MKSMLLAVVAIMMVATTVLATPTDPFKADTANIKRFSLINSGANNTLKVVEGIPKYDGVAIGMAFAQYNASMTELGWDYLRVTANTNLDDAMAKPYYYMGVIEGYLTADRIKAMPVPKASPAAAKWVDEHIAFMRTESQKYSSVGPMWRTVGQLLDQLQGLADGYNLATNGDFTFLDMFMINFGDEIGDVEQAVQVQNGNVKEVQEQMFSVGGKKTPFNSHCSALIKVTEDDLFVSHDTWDVFTGMINRFFKVYDYPEQTVTFSAHAAFIASGDDWYQTSKSQLAIQETTNGVMNATLYLATVPNTISEFLRVMGATILAQNGPEWTSLFGQYNSGTYNNQYMVVDFKLFAPGEMIAPNTLWIAEQLPGFIGRADVSDHLKNHGYWASYNIPYFDYIFDVSGYKQLLETQGNFWSYSKYARSEIFRRNQSDITKIEDMQHMMRYNNFKVDPFSIIQNCTAATNGVCDPNHSSMLSIASRGDLMTVYPTPAEMIAHYGVVASFVAQGCFGAIDSKIARWSNRLSLTPRVISGPTNDQVPTFVWGENSICPNVPSPALSPARIDFPWVDFMNVRNQYYN